MIKLYSFLFLTFLGLGAYAQPVGSTLTLRNIANCNNATGCAWNVASNWQWSGGTSTRVPGDNDIIVIPAGFRVNVTANVGASGAGALQNVKLRIFGTMSVSNGVKMYFDANSVIAIASGGGEILGNAGTSVWVGTAEMTGAASYNGPLVHDNSGYRCKNAQTGCGTWQSGDDAKLSQTLPVKLTSFTATTSNGVVNVKWETSQENNNKEFELQRSANGIDWSTIVTVAGKGTTELKSNYSHTDKAPLKGVSFYRLKQIDYDGKNVISQVVAVKMGENGRFAFDVTPNLVVNNFKVVASEDLRSSEISIFNTVGNRMNVTINRNGNEANVDVSNLPSGQYIIRVQNGTEALTKRFVVNK